MKTVYLVRHAQSPQAPPGTRDLDRPLGAQGLADAASMARRLIERGNSVQQVICSPAARTLATARLLAQAAPTVRITEDARIYHAGTAGLAAVIAGWADTVDSVMLVGHNPAISNLAEYLTGDGPGHFEPCTVACINLPIDRWSEVSKGTGLLAWWDAPDRG